MQLSATRTFAFAIFPILLLLAVAASFVWRFAASERAQQTWVVHTYGVIDSARSVMADLAKAEAGQRGYIVTGRDEYLVGERAAIADLHRDLDSLRTRTTDNALQQNRIGQLQSVVKDRIAALDDGINAFASGGTAAAANVIGRGRGVGLMATARTLLADILNEENRLLADRTNATRQAEFNVAAAAAVMAALVLLLAGVAAFLLSRGIANLRASEAQRAIQAHLLQTTLNSVRDGVAAFDAGGKLTSFNPNFFQLADLPDTLARPGTPLERFNEIDRTRETPVLGDILRPLDENEGIHARATHKGRHMECYRNRIPGGGMLVTCIDVTARVQAEAIMRQSQKMEAIGQLTGGVAHDFNNLLQIIGANLDMLGSSVRGDSKAAARLQNAMFGVERASRLTRQLLAFARRQPLEPRSLDLGGAISNMAEILRRTLGEQIELETIVAGGLWNTLIDPTQFESAVLNLAINARDAMKDGGKLTIELANTFLDERYARENADVTPGQYVMVAVTDTGSGMTQDVIARAFDPFFTTKKEGEGTGLGLSQVYGFVKQSGGHVKFYSEIGEGTTVKLYLPRTRKPQEHIDLAGLPPLEGGNETILAVEDDDGVRASVVDMLTDLGYTVLKASNAGEALGVLAENLGIDLLFTDVVMPGPIATRDFVHRAQALQPRMRVLYTSGYTQNAIVHNGRLDEGISLVSKPYRKDELARKLRTVLAAKAVEISLTPAAAPAAPAAEPSAKTKVLIVEDDAFIRMSVIDMLEELGYKWAEASAAAQALETLDRDTTIGILLTDLGLPGMRGDELALEAQRRRPGLKVILSSGYSSHVPSGGLQAGAEDTLLPKPFDLGQLKAALEGQASARPK